MTKAKENYIYVILDLKDGAMHVFKNLDSADRFASPLWATAFGELISVPICIDLDTLKEAGIESIRLHSKFDLDSTQTFLGVLNREYCE